MVNVKIQGTKLPFIPDYLYRIFVADDDIEYPRPYDKFTSSEKLTAQEMLDVEAGYKEALDGYVPPMLELSQMEKLRR